MMHPLIENHRPAPSERGRRRLRLLSIVMPATFVAGLLTAALLLADRLPIAVVASAGILAVAAAAILFSSFVFGVVSGSEAELRERNRQLAAVQAAATELASERQLHLLLERFVELSRTITDARYGALAIRRPDGSIDEFITSGVTPDERIAMGDPPVGKGLLGVNIYEGEAVRVRDMGQDPRSVGFPPRHPPMTSLLGVPVVAKGVIVGNLYLTDKASAAEFSETDEEMVKLFAAHAGAAVEHTRLEEKLRDLAVVQERDRIAMDLHDGIIQSIYAVGLKLEGAGEDTATDPSVARATIDESIEDLSKVIRDVRSYILELRPARLGEDLGESLQALAAEFRAQSLIETSVDVSPPLPALSHEERSAAFHIAQEALSNARKHSQATRVSIELHAPDGVVRLDVRDNGQGFDVSGERPSHHRGVGNMAARAASIDGTLTIESAYGQGTLVRLELPRIGRTEEQA